MNESESRSTTVTFVSIPLCLAKSEIGIDIVLIDINILDTDHRIFHLRRRGIVVDHLLVIFQRFVVFAEILVNQSQLGQGAHGERRLRITVHQAFQYGGAVVESVHGAGAPQLEHRVVDVVALAVADNRDQRLDLAVVLINQTEHHGPLEPGVIGPDRGQADRLVVIFDRLVVLALGESDVTQPVESVRPQIVLGGISVQGNY